MTAKGIEIRMLSERLSRAFISPVFTAHTETPMTRAQHNGIRKVRRYSCLWCRSFERDIPFRTHMLSAKHISAITTPKIPIFATRSRKTRIPVWITTDIRACRTGIRMWLVPCRIAFVTVERE